MYVNIIFASILSLLWVLAEVRLIIIDRKQKKGSKHSDYSSRTFNILAIIIGLAVPPVFIFFPILTQAFINTKLVFILGLLISFTGLAFRQYSIFILGKYFRTTVEIEENQNVIQTGPYKYIRHPSYTGFILFFFGYGLIMQNWIAIPIAFGPSIAALLYRIKIEEAEMVKGIGQEYINYQKKTKKLIPGIW